MAKTRRNKNRGGSRKNRRNNTDNNVTPVVENVMMGGKNRRNKTEGGRKKTRKLSKGASNWQQSVMKVYKEMKAKNPATKLGEAMKRAAELKRKGQL